VRRAAGKIFGGLREAGLRHGNPVADAEAPQIVALADDLLNPVLALRRATSRSQAICLE
jgi:hypothetical protein